MNLTTKYLQSQNYYADELDEDATEAEILQYKKNIVNKLGVLETLLRKCKVRVGEDYVRIECPFYNQERTSVDIPLDPDDYKFAKDLLEDKYFQI